GLDAVAGGRIVADPEELAVEAGVPALVPGGLVGAQVAAGDLRVGAARAGGQPAGLDGEVLQGGALVRVHVLAHRELEAAAHARHGEVGVVGVDGAAGVLVAHAL